MAEHDILVESLKFFGIHLKSFFTYNFYKHDILVESLKFFSIYLKSFFTYLSTETIGGPSWTHFSAVCWFYGRYLYDQLKVPIGLISSSWNATQIESWMSPRALKKCEDFFQ